MAQRRRRFEPHGTGRSDDADAFIPDPGEGPATSDVDLAESMGEGFIEAATTGEDRDEEALDSPSVEEIGGPFVETDAAEELAAGTDLANPPDAEQEPLPRAVAGLVAEPVVESAAAADRDDGQQDVDDAAVREVSQEVDPDLDARQAQQLGGDPKRR